MHIGCFKTPAPEIKRNPCLGCLIFGYFVIEKRSSAAKRNRNCPIGNMPLSGDSNNFAISRNRNRLVQFAHRRRVRLIILSYWMTELIHMQFHCYTPMSIVAPFRTMFIAFDSSKQNIEIIEFHFFSEKNSGPKDLLTVVSFRCYVFTSRWSFCPRCWCHSYWLHL